MDEKTRKLIRLLDVYGWRAKRLADQLSFFADLLKDYNERIVDARKDCSDSCIVSTGGLLFDMDQTELDIRRAAARLRGEYPWISKD